MRVSMHASTATLRRGRGSRPGAASSAARAAATSSIRSAFVMGSRIVVAWDHRPDGRRRRDRDRDRPAARGGRRVRVGSRQRDTWYENIKSVEWETPKPAEVGSRIRFEAAFLGRRLAYTYEVREIAEGERFVMSTSEGPFPMETTYTWDDAPGGGTRMTLRNRGEPSGFASVAAPVMARAMKRANGKDLERLKAVLER